MPAALTITLGGVDITTKVDFPSIVMQLAGSQEVGSCDFDIVDEGLTVTATAESTLTVTEVGSATVLFGGFTRSPQTVLTMVGRIIHIKAYDYNALLDRSIVVSDSRIAGESDHARLVYLMGIYGTQFSSDYSQIATLNGSLPAQKFIAITLRQAIERVLGQASYKASYYVDATGRLHTYDRTVVTAAPFNIRVGTPGGGEIAPQDWTHDRDTDNLANAIYIVGATAAGSGWFTDVTSISTYGRRERFFNAPDSDTAAKASQVGLAVLGDQKDPVPRATFTTKSPADGWRIGQSITVNSAQDNLVGQSYRIAKVSTHYLNPAGDREYAIELGAPQVTLSALLAAAHGGGGGFPWHSPGGAGWAGSGGVVGSGTTGGTVSSGGGCACNTPYVCGGSSTTALLDDFNRTVAGGWGTPSAGGFTYNGTPTARYDFNVNGTTGQITLLAESPFVGASGFLIAHQTASVTQAFPIEYRFDVTMGTTATNATLRFLIADSAITSLDTATFDYDAKNHLISMSGMTTFSANFGLDLSGGKSMRLRVENTGGSLLMEYRAWAIGGTEPTTWDHTFTDTQLGFTTPWLFNAEIIQNRTNGVTYPAVTASFDNLQNASCAPANSGQPYPWTKLGMGNSGQIVFSTLTAFRPGSLEARVDSSSVTPIAQTPDTGSGTGTFTLSFAPSSAESIWARWVAA